MKIKKILPIILLSGTLTSCTGTFFGIETTVTDSWCKETDQYIIFRECVYIKETKLFETHLDNFKEFYNDESNEESTNEYSLIKNGFYSSQPKRDNFDDLNLNEIENTIWNYAKGKSVKNKSPYLIEGKCKETEDYVYFNVNVNNGSTLKGGSFNNMTIVSSTLNRLNKTTLEIEQLEYFEKKAISSFDEQHVMLVKKNKKDLIYLDLNSRCESKLTEINKFRHLYNCGSYLLIEDVQKSPFEYSICNL